VMKFESKFGLGEIVVTHEKTHGGRRYPGFIMEIIAIQFGKDRSIDYICRVAGNGMSICCKESELIGDPDYDQKIGNYLDGKDE
jgi:hypothetical protein